MKKALIFIVTLFLSGILMPAMADKYYNSLLKSQDGEMKYKAAVEYFEQQDYKKTIRLL